jgi:hypothetical protein
MSEPTSAPPGFVKAMAGSLARHAATAIAGSFVTLGLLSQSQTTEFVDVVGAIGVGLLTLAWSAIQKRRTLPPGPARPQDPPY